MNRKRGILAVCVLMAAALSGCGGNADQAETPAETAQIEDIADTADENDTKEETPSEEDSAEDQQRQIVEREPVTLEMGTLEAVHYALPEAAEEWDIYVEPIEGITDDFIRGVDASEVLALENSGVVYTDYDGNEKDVFEILAENGVNYIRLRIWNDPYDEEGHGYGGGNCDLDTVLALGVRATTYGMRVCIDFHYSDFWADPTRQLAPKAWKGQSVLEKSQNIYDFTYDSLNTLLSAGVDVGMVQVGNETNYGMSGEKDLDAVARMIQAGSKGVRAIAAAYSRDIKVVVHYTNTANYDQIDGLAQILERNEVDYDVMGFSYYTYWDGTFEQVAATLDNLRSNYGKDVCIVEISYPYTDQDGDGTGNSVWGGELVEGYTSSVQSQSAQIRDLCNLAWENGALGVFYWGGIWVPVGSDYTQNQEKWETFGSGWASSYAADYDPEVGTSYGGSSWDNQALFDFDGRALGSLATFKYLKYGTITEPAIDFVQNQSVVVGTGSAFVLPDTVPAIYNDRTIQGEVAVTWNSEEAARIDTDTDGEYTVSGETEDGESVTLTVTVKYLNLLENGGFEEEDTSMWAVAYTGDDPTNFQKNSSDAHEGDVAFHYWSESDMEFSIEQTVTGLSAGTYKASVCSQGGDFDWSVSEITFYVVTEAGEQTAAIKNDGWVNWQIPEITDLEIPEGGSVTVGVRVKANAKAWGTFDDFALNKTA